MTEKLPNSAHGVGTDFLTNLRNATAEMHARLENTQLSKSLLADNVTRYDYAKYLLVMSKIVDFTEEKIFPVLKEIVPDIDERTKVLRITDDLEKLDEDFTQLALQTYKPVSGKLSVPFALGFMYVTEGSVLGGKFILRHLESRLGISEANAGSFFATYGQATGRMWKFFLQTLSGYAARHDCSNEIISGAITAFSSIQIFFETSEHEDQGYSKPQHC